MNDENSIFRYDTGIEGVKEKAGWLIGALAVLTIVFGGVQLNALGFTDLSSVRPHVWFALAVSIVAVCVSLFLAAEALISERRAARNPPASTHG